MITDLNKYKFYQGTDEVVAVSTYAGKTVRGKAKCHPDDVFNLQDGKELAAARCQKKISEKRLKRANKKLTEAGSRVMEAVELYNRMIDYRNDSLADIEEVSAHIESLLSRM